MCTLVVLWQTYPSAPLVLALNRDELLVRRTAPLARWEDAPIVAGRDLEGGGTWFGVGPRVVAGITNHRSGMGSPRGARSRGELVVDALTKGSVAEVRASLLALDMAAYGGFHLLVSDGDTLSVFSNRGGVLEETVASPGVHVLGNFGLDDEHDSVVATVRPAVTRFLTKQLASGAPDEEALATFLKDILARHGPGWPCVHLGHFGTRSSALLFLREGISRGGDSRDKRAESSRLEVVDGSPCEAPWKNESALLVHRDQRRG